jgi:hypothetical protein
MARRNDETRRDDLPPVAAAMLVRATAARPELALAALANAVVRGLLADSPRIYSEAGLRQSPIVRAEFEHATVIGHPGEALAIGLGKHWGGFRGFRPLRPDDPVDPFYVLFVLRESNPYQRRVTQRKAMKRRLPKSLRRWVNEAYRRPRRDFLAKLPEDAAAAIRRSLGLDPVGFWRAARGTLDLGLPAPPVQLLLFADADDAIAPRWRK